MKFGILKDIKEGEYRVICTPKEVKSIVASGHEVQAQRDCGVAIMDYYKYAHSSGTFGAIGSVVGVGKIYGYTKEQLNNVISIAEFNAPLVPGIRSVEYPSMNKDGVPFGVMTGVLALIDSECGFEGNKNLLESDEYKHQTIQEKNITFQIYILSHTLAVGGHTLQSTQSQR